MRASVLWTGGKDSALALHEAALAGHEVASLVTFAPPRPSFLAHPLSVIAAQARAMRLTHYVVEIREPFRESYEKAFIDLRRRFGIEAVVTGDIAEVEGHPNWIRERSCASGFEVLTPLWGWERMRVLERLLEARFKVIFSCVKEPWFTEQWLGRELDAEAISELVRLRGQTGLDLCGEQGEYHTMTIDGPQFKAAIRLREWSKHRQDLVMHLKVDSVSVEPKPIPAPDNQADDRAEAKF